MKRKEKTNKRTNKQKTTILKFRKKERKKEAQKLERKKNKEYKKTFKMAWFGLLLFYGTSTIVGYLMSNQFLYIQTVLFEIVLFSINIVFFVYKW